MRKSEKETLESLTHRIERLEVEYSVNAPAVIKTTEVRLIMEACAELLT